MLRGIREVESKLVADAERALYEGHLGVRGAGLYGALSAAIGILGGFASCRWGCKHADHVPEKLMRRLVNASLASLRLGWAGYNDEALATIRVVAELINLYQLFDCQADQLAKWSASPASARQRDFGPVRVREQMERLGVTPAYDQLAYKALCEAGVHVTPDSASRSHELEGNRLTVGPRVSITGLLLIWTELGYAARFALTLQIVQASLPDEVGAEAHTTAEALIAAIGRGEMRMTNYDAVRAWFREQVLNQ